MAADQDSEQEGVFGSDNLSSAYLEPVTSEDEIDYSKVYALFTFVASMEGQISVLKGEPLDLLDDSNSYWWAVKCISTTEIGYIPAENIETPYEKLARFNRSRNVELAEVKNMDLEKSGESKKPKRTTKLQFAEFVTEIYEDGEVEAEMPPAIPEKDGLSSNSKQKQVSSMKLDEDVPLSGTPKKSSFIDRLFGRKPNPKTAAKLAKANKPQPIDTGVPSSTTTAPSSASIPTSDTDKPYSGGLTRGGTLNEIPVNVLRVFASPNVKFNATFKSVSFEKNTLISGLIVNTIKKFRVHNVNPEDYYLTVTPIDVKSAVGSGGERVLLPNENINKVLDTYGVSSYTVTRSDNENAKQADGTIKITIYKYDDTFANTIPIRICKDDVPNSWEKVDVDAESTVEEVIAAASLRYQIESSAKFRLFNMTTKSLLDRNASIKTLAQEAAAKDQMLTLRFITNMNYTPPPRSNASGVDKVSRLDPGRPTSLEDPQQDLSNSAPTLTSGFSASASPDPTYSTVPVPNNDTSLSRSVAPPVDSVENVLVPAPPVLIPRVEAPKPTFGNNDSRIPSSTPSRQLPFSNSRPEKQRKSDPSSKNVLNFDEMISSLDEGIRRVTETKKRAPPRKTSIHQYLGQMENEIEILIVDMLAKSTTSDRRKSRLSALYNSSFAQQAEEQEDPGDLFLSLKNSASELMRLESKLNGMVSHILMKGGMIVA